MRSAHGHAELSDGLVLFKNKDTELNPALLFQALFVLDGSPLRRVEAAFDVYDKQAHRSYCCS